MGKLTTFTRISTSKEFSDAWAFVTERPVSYAEFSKLPMPPNVDSFDLWTVFMSQLKAIGYSGVTRSWLVQTDEGESWYYLPKSSENNLHALSALASGESHLNRFVREAGANDLAFFEGMINDVVALAQCDGLDITEDVATKLWTGRLSPRSPAEKVIANVSQLFYKTRLFEGRVFSQSLANELYETLMSGVSLDDLRLMPRQHYFSKRSLARDRLSDPEFVSQSLEALAENARNANSFRDIVLAIIIASTNLHELHYLPALNDLVEFLMRRIYLVSHGLPALSYVPFIYEGISSSSLSRLLHEEEARTKTGLGINCTRIMAEFIEVLLRSVRKLNDLVLSLEEQNAESSRFLDTVDGLNLRQRSFLQLALSRPPATDFTIRDYARAYNVVRATARTDLFDLVNKGLLSQRKEERTFLFRLVPHRMS